MIIKLYIFNDNIWKIGNFLVVQWLGLHTFTAVGPVMIPGVENKGTTEKKKLKTKEVGKCIANWFTNYANSMMIIYFNSS